MRGAPLCELREKIDILIAAGVATRMVPVAQHAVPIVFAHSGDPVAAGYVQSLARPGGNVTGLSGQELDLLEKQFGLIPDLLPRARRVLGVSSATLLIPVGDALGRAFTAAAARLGLETMIRPVRDRAALEAALADGERAGCDSMLCFTDSVTVPNRHLIADHAHPERVPAPRVLQGGRSGELRA